MESYADVQTVEEEEISAMSEDFLPLPNQDVVNMLSEDTRGNLLYKGSPVYNRPYDAFYGNTSDFFLITGDGNSYVNLFLTDTSLFEEGREIKDLFLVIDGDRFSVKDLSAYDDVPYVVNMNKLIMSRNTNLLHVVTLASDFDSSFIVRIANYESFEFELELYK